MNKEKKNKSNNDIENEKIINKENTKNNNEIKVIKYNLKYKDLIQNFLDKVIKEAIEKQKDEDDDLVKARSFDQDLFSKLTLQNENNTSKLNKSSSDGEENDFEI